MANTFWQYAQQTNSLQLFLDAGPAVLVEGGKDQRLYQQLVDVCVYVGGNKANVIRSVLSLSTPSQKKKCRAIIDRDYDFFLNRQKTDKEFIYTDAHSLETLLWMTDNNSHTMLRKIVGNVVRDRDLHAAMMDIPSICDWTFSSAYSMGLVRLANDINKWGISQSIVLQDELFDSESHELILEDYVQRILVSSGRNPAFKYDVLNAVDELRECEYDKWQIMQGHDISSLFYYFLSTRYTIIDRELRNIDDFEKLTRSVYDSTNLHESNVCTSLQNWAATVV